MIAGPSFNPQSPINASDVEVEGVEEPSLLRILMPVPVAVIVRVPIHRVASPASNIVITKTLEFFHAPI